MKSVFVKGPAQSQSNVRRLMTTSHGAGSHAPSIKNTRMVANNNRITVSHMTVVMVIMHSHYYYYDRHSQVRVQGPKMKIKLFLC